MSAPAIVPKLGRLFTATQAAAYLGVSVHKVRRLVALREIVVLRTAAGRLEGIYEADCDAWQRRRRIPVPEPPARPSTQQVDDRIRQIMPKERVF